MLWQPAIEQILVNLQVRDQTLWAQGPGTHRQPDGTDDGAAAPRLARDQDLAGAIGELVGLHPFPKHPLRGIRQEFEDVLGTRGSHEQV